MKNYKNIRHEPYIYGFTMLGFITFSILTILSLLSLLLGVTFLRCILCLVFVGISYLISKYLLSNEKVTAYLFDNKLPKNYTNYE